MNYEPVNLSRQIQSDYLAYSMAVIIGRAIPSLTDGLKPAQRRVLTAMKWLNLSPANRYMKSARVEGETMGKLHPHGGAYGTMVTMAAPHNNNLPFIDGHGNWGSSVDGAAAARYTECKTSPFAWDCLLADSETWQLTENYDGSLKEPVELNVKVPAVLLNGQEGIGVGFATKIPPHSLRDVCEAVCKGTELVPSFPTGCDIIRDEGLKNYVATGQGTLRLRAKQQETTFEKARGGKQRATLRFTNLPPTTNPEKLGDQIKQALEKGKFDGVATVTDESDRTGDCLAVGTKPGVDPITLARYLYHYTDLESAYPARLLVVDGTRPVELSPSELVSRWKVWRLDCLGRQFAHELSAAKNRLEIVIGLLKAISQIDKVIKTIRASESKKDALIKLVDRPFKFTKTQASAILEMRLHQLTGLDATALETEQETLSQTITSLQDLIQNPKTRETHLKKEVRSIGTRYGEKRRSEIIDAPESLVVEKGTKTQAPVSKPRFLKVDTKKGTITQAKGPRGALIVDRKEKVILMTEDGTLKKVPATFKGPISTEYSPVVLARREAEIAIRKFLCVFELDGALKAMVLEGESLTKTTSKGKNFLPDGAKLHYFGEKPHVLTWKSTRKRPVTLDLTIKVGKPGGKGVKVGNVADLA